MGCLSFYEPAVKGTEYDTTYRQLFIFMLWHI